MAKPLVLGRSLIIAAIVEKLAGVAFIFVLLTARWIPNSCKVI